MSMRYSSYSPEGPATGAEFTCFSDAPWPGAARLTLRGELDLASAPQLGEALSNMNDAAVVVLDLSRLTFMDSSGLHTILTAHARMSEANRRLVLVSGPPCVQRIFELTGTNQVLEFAEAPGPGDQRSSNGHSRDQTTGSGRFELLDPMLRDG